MLQPLAQFLFNTTTGRLPTGPTGSSAVKLLYTHYHNIPKLEQIAPMAVKWQWWCSGGSIMIW